MAFENNRMNSWFGRGAAFGAGFMLAPTIIWALLIAAAVVFVAVITHIWILYLVLAFIVVGMITSVAVELNKPVPKDPEITPAMWRYIHRTQEHRSNEYPGGGIHPRCLLCAEHRTDPAAREKARQYLAERIRRIDAGLGNGTELLTP
jgi:hypothetical protein